MVDTRNRENSNYLSKQWGKITQFYEKAYLHIFLLILEAMLLGASGNDVVEDK